MTDSENADDIKVVMKQKLLGVDEVFVYSIPKLSSAAGYRAEDWDLAKPLQTCSLVVERRDDSCAISLFAKKLKKDGPKGATEEHLFALCLLDLEGGKTLQQFVESVTDSSRYFVIRISDEKTGRHASIGMGFRERDDASNFRMALQEYERSLQRERTAKALHVAYNDDEQGQTAAPAAADGDRSKNPLPQVGNLTLKEGEKIHLDLKKKSATITERPPKASSSSSALPLLKKPPPSPAVAKEIKEVGGIDLDEAISDVASSYSGSEGAVADLTDDDEWNDFEGSQS